MKDNFCECKKCIEYRKKRGLLSILEIFPTAVNLEVLLRKLGFKKSEIKKMIKTSK